MNQSAMTQNESMICTLARAAGGHDDVSFELAEIAILAWKHDRRFALRGSANAYPDSKHAEIVVGHCTRNNGWLARVSPRRYRITEAGLKAAKGLMNGEMK